MNEDYCPLCGNQYNDPLYLGQDNNPYHRCPACGLPASNPRSHKWYRSDPLQCFFREQYLNEIITAPGKKQCIEHTDRIERRYCKDDNGRNRRGYAYGINQRYCIGSDSIWNREDTVQECYRAFYEGYNIIKAVERAIRKDFAISKIKRPPGGREKKVEDYGETTVRQQYPILQFRRANPWIIVGGEKKYFADIKKQKRWKDEEQVYHWSKATWRKGYIHRKQHKYNKVESKLVRGEEVHEIAEEKYALPDVDRPLLEEEAINTGGEVVLWRALEWEKESFEDETTAALKQATEECFCKGLKDGYSFDQVGYNWDNYHGYCLDT